MLLCSRHINIQALAATHIVNQSGGSKMFVSPQLHGIYLLVGLTVSENFIGCVWSLKLHAGCCHNMLRMDGLKEEASALIEDPVSLRFMYLMRLQLLCGGGTVHANSRLRLRRSTTHRRCYICSQVVAHGASTLRRFLARMCIGGITAGLMMRR